ncbi:MAG: ABC transporter ATP-binding protein [Clostridiales Family XIII bacterium]|jgi:NitT/TauT family transport system ATP-binding protein|nr:ABC transporter ATP-binding protein [Clostridiales Family XIII bacterium]
MEMTKTKPFITLEHVNKEFVTKNKTTRALSDVSLEVSKGEFLVIVGASGCGKSTIIRLIDDIIKPTSGTIQVDGFEYDNTKPISKDFISRMGFVFQIPNLYPWLTVRENLLLPLKLLNINTKEHVEYAEYLLDMVHLQNYAGAYPNEISGGMAQRLGVIRAMVHKPEILMMDEPYGALDELTREQMDIELLDLWKQLGTTIIFITHDVEEAVLVGSRIYVMKSDPGRIVADVPIEFGTNRTINNKFTHQFSVYCDQITELIGEIDLSKIK